MNYTEKIIWLYIPAINFFIWWFIGTKKHVLSCLQQINQQNDNIIYKCDHSNSNSNSNIKNDYKCTLGYNEEYEVDYEVVDSKGNIN